MWLLLYQYHWHKSLYLISLKLLPQSSLGKRFKTPINYEWKYFIMFCIFSLEVFSFSWSTMFLFRDNILLLLTGNRRWLPSQAVGWGQRAQGKQGEKKHKFKVLARRRRQVICLHQLWATFFSIFRNFAS